MTAVTTFQQKYGPWALITGASSGIGAEFATQLAAKNLNVVLAARQGDKLQRIAQQISDRYGVEANVITADLTQQQGVDAVVEASKDIEIGMLVNNAGREDSGHFLTTPLETAVNTLDLNVRAPLQLTHHFAQQMVARKRGGIVFMSSLVAFQGVPLIANYAATKAYDLIFAESLAAELRHYNIDVLAVAPGFTDTALSPDFEFSGLPIEPMPPALVASLAIKSLGRKRLTVPGALNKFLYATGKYLQPRTLNTFSFGKVFKAVLRNKLKRLDEVDNC